MQKENLKTTGFALLRNGNSGVTDVTLTDEARRRTFKHYIGMGKPLDFNKLHKSPILELIWKSNALSFEIKEGRYRRD